MKSDRPKLHQLFQAAKDLQVKERQSFLLEQCGEDSELLRELEELLQYDQIADHEKFLEVQPATRIISLTDARVGSYRLKEVLGQGGTGTVYRAIRENDYAHEVAIKLLSLAISKKQARDRFLKEREILANLDHPRIAKILDGGTTTDQHLYYVMPMIKGRHIDDFCDEQHLSFQERVALLVDVCETISYAHKNEVIHRDLKPSNLLVTEDKTVFVVDFGLARFPNGLGALTLTGEVLGTPHYMAPEMAAGKGNSATPATDIYSLGCILYKLLTKQAPFQGDHPWKTMLRIVQDEPLPPSKVNPGIPADLDSICLKCLRKDPAVRYKSATELADDLKRFLNGRPVLAKRPTWIDYGRNWAYRRRWSIAAISLTLVTGLVTGLIYNNSKTRNALELAKQATDNLLKISIQMGGQPGMQRPQVELLRKAVSTYADLLPSLGDEQTYLNYFKGRHELVAAYLRLNAKSDASQEAKLLLNDVEEYSRTHHSIDLSIQLAQCYALVGNAVLLPEDLAQRKVLLNQAINVLRNVHEVNPSHDGVAGFLAEKYCELAWHEYLTGSSFDAEKHFNQALIEFRRLYSLYPKDDPQIRIRLSGCLRLYWFFLNGKQDRGKQRLDLLDEAAQLDTSLKMDFPDRPEHRETTIRACTQMASILESQGDWKRAYEMLLEVTLLYEHLKKLYPDIARYQYQHASHQVVLGELAFALGKTEDAKRLFSHSIKTHEDAYRIFGMHRQGTSELAYVLANCPIKELRNGNRALELSRQCVEHFPDDKYVARNHTMSLLRCGELKQAHQELQRLLTLPWLEDEIGVAHTYLALTLAKMGLREQALKQLSASDRHMDKYPKEVIMLRLREEVRQELVASSK